MNLLAQSDAATLASKELGVSASSSIRSSFSCPICPVCREHLPLTVTSAARAYLLHMSQLFTQLPESVIPPSSLLFDLFVIGFEWSPHIAPNASPLFTLDLTMSDLLFLLEICVEAALVSLKELRSIQNDPTKAVSSKLAQARLKERVESQVAAADSCFAALDAAILSNNSPKSVDVELRFGWLRARRTFLTLVQIPQYNFATLLIAAPVASDVIQVSPEEASLSLKTLLGDISTSDFSCNNVIDAFNSTSTGSFSNRFSSSAETVDPLQLLLSELTHCVDLCDSPTLGSSSLSPISPSCYVPAFSDCAPLGTASTRRLSKALFQKTIADLSFFSKVQTIIKDSKMPIQPSLIRTRLQQLENLLFERDTKQLAALVRRDLINLLRKMCLSAEFVDIVLWCDISLVLHYVSCLSALSVSHPQSATRSARISFRHFPSNLIGRVNKKFRLLFQRIFARIDVHFAGAPLPQSSMSVSSPLYSILQIARKELNNSMWLNLLKALSSVLCFTLLSRGKSNRLLIFCLRLIIKIAAFLNDTKFEPDDNGLSVFQLSY